MADKKLEPVIEYYDDGKIKLACTIDENGKLDGPAEAYYDNGQLGAKCTYKDGEKDGPYEKYHKNGQLDVKCTYKNGKYDGPYEEYHDNGQLEKKCTYKDGKELTGKEAEKYLQKWNEEHNSKEARKGLNARLRQIDKQMAPTQLRQSVKRAEVARFRTKFPNKKDGR